MRLQECQFEKSTGWMLHHGSDTFDTNNTQYCTSSYLEPEAAFLKYLERFVGFNLPASRTQVMPASQSHVNGKVVTTFAGRRLEDVMSGG